MDVRFHPHAIDRLRERGATETEVRTAVESGERSPAKFGRTVFRYNVGFDGLWRGRRYRNKQIEAIAVAEGGDWLVITIMVRFY